MPTIKLSKTIISEAETASKTFNRSVVEQIEHWVYIGKLIEANPDLSYEFIENILIAQEEAKAGKLKVYRLNKKYLSPSKKERLKKTIC